MPTYLAQTYNSNKSMPSGMLCLTKNSNKIWCQNSGFSIIEILVAVSLLALLFTVIDFGSSSDREKLEIAMEDIERAIRFSRNEAVVTNKIVRLKFDLTKVPISYVVESSENSNLLLPEYVDEERLGIEERKKRDEKVKKSEQAFIAVPEFQKNIRKLNEDVKITGVVTSLSKDLVTEGIATIYFYPTGHQDMALVIFNTFEELATLESESVRERFHVNYYPLNEYVQETFDDVVFEQTKQVFNEWSSNQ